MVAQTHGQWPECGPGGKGDKVHSLAADKVRYSYRGPEWQVRALVQPVPPVCSVSGSHMLPFFILVAIVVVFQLVYAHISSVISCFS